MAVGINKAVWESLDASDRRIIEALAACERARSLAELIVTASGFGANQPDLLAEKISSLRLA